MTIAQIYEEAKRQLDKDVITIGEFSEIVDREFQEPNKWIPLNAKGSEPQKNGKYLVCFDDGYITAMYYENGEWWILNNQPIAWMPLPEPYKTECDKQYG